MLDMLSRYSVGLVTRTITNPSAGSNLHWESPEDTRILVHSISLILTTDATVANRRVTIQGSHGSVAFTQAPSPGHQVATEAISYRFAPCILGIDESADLSFMWAPISSHLYLERDHTLETAIINLQAGDQISKTNIRYYQSLPR